MIDLSIVIDYYRLTTPDKEQLAPLIPLTRELKQQRFSATHVNRKWPFFIFWRWFCANFQSNRLYNSKEAKEYKFYIIKAC